MLSSERRLSPVNVFTQLAFFAPTQIERKGAARASGGKGQYASTQAAVRRLGGCARRVAGLAILSHLVSTLRRHRPLPALVGDLNLPQS